MVDSLQELLDELSQLPASRWRALVEVACNHPHTG